MNIQKNENRQDHTIPLMLWLGGYFIIKNVDLHFGSFTLKGPYESEDIRIEYIKEGKWAMSGRFISDGQKRLSDLLDGDIPQRLNMRAESHHLTGVMMNLKREKSHQGWGWPEDIFDFISFLQFANRTPTQEVLVDKSGRQRGKP